MVKIILHIDLNAFFCRCEEIKDPSLEGKAMLVGGTGRAGIVSTCSYKAREYGVRSGMPTFKAVALCPNIIIKPCDFSYYHLMSREFFTHVKAYSPYIEMASIDECFADFTSVLSKEKDPLKYLEKMQQDLFKKTKLKCSIGVAPTKFLAKMGSDMKKPMGITILRRRDIKTKLYPLPIKDMFGIGKKSYPRLEKMGIKTIGDLGNLIFNNEEEATQILGKFYETAKAWLSGYSNDVVNLEPNDPKSVGMSTTFVSDTSNYEEIRNIFSQVSKEVSQRAKREQKKGKTVQIVAKDNEFHSFNRSISFQDATNEYDKIFYYAMKAFDRFFDGQMLRLVGVTLTNFENPSDEPIQMTLFNYEQHEEENETHLLISSLNNKMDKNMFKRASEIKGKETKNGSK